jgi:CheY-like chemotaxis protein
VQNATTSKTILIVDDSVDSGRPLARLLRHFGHEGIHVASGEEALAFVRQRVPDLMLLDVMMPGIDGMEVLRALRSDPQTRDMAVVMFSAVSDPEYRRHAISKGANDYWVKSSLDIEELRCRIERLLEETESDGPVA